MGRDGLDALVVNDNKGCVKALIGASIELARMDGFIDTSCVIPCLTKEGKSLVSKYFGEELDSLKRDPKFVLEFLKICPGPTDAWDYSVRIGMAMQSPDAKAGRLFGLLRNEGKIKSMKEETSYTPEVIFALLSADITGYLHREGYLSLSRKSLGWDVIQHPEKASI